MIRVKIQLARTNDLILARNGYLPEDQIKRVKINALVDSGAYWQLTKQ